MHTQPQFNYIINKLKLKPKQNMKTLIKKHKNLFVIWSSVAGPMIKDDPVLE